MSLPVGSEGFLTVSELNNFIRDVLKSGFPRAVWVCGEVQGYDRGKDKKHVFFELCEKDPLTREIMARAGLVIFANTRPKIDAILKKAENAFVLKDDIEVKFLCTVDFYPPHGQVRLVVEAIDPVYTLGKIAQDRQRLIALLKQKGVLDKNKLAPLSPLPLRVGLITSFDSAAYHDFVDELKKSGFGFKIFVVSATMQGKNAESSVVKSLQILSGLKGLDVVVITRGGGSIAELGCFDSQAIAEAIAACQLPVFSGIGHEINTTVTCLASHTYAKTPTAVAKLLINQLMECLALMAQKEERLVLLAQAHVDAERSRLRDSALFVQNGTMAALKHQQQEIGRMAEAFKRAPLGVVKESRKRLLHNGDFLRKTIYLHVQNLRSKMSNYHKLVEMADPKNILKRGFSITRAQNGKVIRHLKDAAKTKIMVTMLVDGKINSKIIDLVEE